MELLSLIIFLFTKKITEEDNHSSKVVTMEEALYDVKVDRIGNLVK